jgi:hypothetical protein
MSGRKSPQRHTARYSPFDYFFLTLIKHETNFTI